MVITDQIRTPRPEFFARLEASVLDQLGTSPEVWSRASEAYDAVILAALAAEAAGTDGSASVGEISAITRGDEPCVSYEECRDRLLEGARIDVGLLSPVTELAPTRRVAIGSFHLDRRRGDIREEFDVEIGPRAVDITPGSSAERAGNGQLVIGSLGAELGPGSHSAPGTRAAIENAISEVNEAGGVFGRMVEHVPIDIERWDVETTTLIAAAQRLSAQNVDVVITSGPTAAMFSVVDELTSSGVTVMLNAGTNRRLDLVDDHGLMVRLAAPDDLEFAALVDAVVFEEIGDIVVVTSPDADGQAALTSTLEAAERRGVRVVEVLDQSESVVDAEVWSSALISGDAAVVFLGTDLEPFIDQLSVFEIDPGDIAWFATSRLHGGDGIDVVMEIVTASAR